jgi:valyl-tRNA synthetase
MNIPKQYDPSTTEEKWYAHWQEQNFFHSEPDEREPYTIVIPPPNVTGVLHMGHMLNNTIQDVLVRRARLLGKNACWVPGTDHASIATEAKVVKKLEAEGIKKSSLSREEFMKHAWEWTEKYGGSILGQLKRLGASCDWERTRFTLENDLYDAVIDVFIDLYKKGLIYRGVRMINWDPSAKTALSDEEVVHKEVNSKLYYIKYQIEDSEETLTIATTRPETILGDSAICINPKDERHANLKGKRALVPLINRSIPIIEDDYVDVEFGTGCLKVTPAHDINDYELGMKHNLETIDILNDDGTLNENAQLYVGEDRFVVRAKIIKELEAKGQLVKVEELINKMGYSERTDAVIEPKLSLQWFCDMKEMATPALEKVMDDTIQFHPANSKNTYKHWMENIKDWCVSRQLWWGQRIPAFYYGQGPKDFVVAKTVEEALPLAVEKSGQEIKAEDLRQDEDVLDTWFSSWLWPISVFNGIKEPNNADIQYYYPTNDLVTGQDIMFFWVARMIMAAYEFKGEAPFKNVYFTGMVRDDEGRKMSKQLGNSPDPIGLMEKYSADGVRVGMLLSAPAGNDLLFKENLCEQGRNFSNKIWNALRLVKSWTVDANEEPTAAAEVANDWFASTFQKSLKELDDNFDKFRISDCLMTAYKLTWDEFCSWYLEMVKPEFGKSLSKQTYDQVVVHFEKLLKVLHPFMPFITEEIWHLIQERDDKDCIMVAQWPKAEKADASAEEFKAVKELIVELRNLRRSKNIPFKEKLSLIVGGEKSTENRFNPIIKKLCNLDKIEHTSEEVPNSISFVVAGLEYFVPLAGQIDVEAEKEKIQADIDYQTGFLKSVEKKLSNERFVSNAPDQVVEMERKKLADAETKIELLKKQLAAL